MSYLLLIVEPAGQREECRARSRRSGVPGDATLRGRTSSARRAAGRQLAGLGRHAAEGARRATPRRRRPLRRGQGIGGGLLFGGRDHARRSAGHRGRSPAAARPRPGPPSKCAKSALASFSAEVPLPSARPTRLASAVEVIYSVFNEGYAATAGDKGIRSALCEEALRMGRVLAGLMPDEPESQRQQPLTLQHRVGRNPYSQGLIYVTDLQLHCRFQGVDSDVQTPEGSRQAMRYSAARRHEVARTQGRPRAPWLCFAQEHRVSPQVLSRWEKGIDHLS